MNKFRNDILFVCWSTIGTMAAIAVVQWMYWCVFIWIPE